MRAWSFAGSGQGGGGSAARRFRPGRWGWLLIWTGALALISMTAIGHAAAIVSLISVIGIPLYFLLAALPSIFLIMLFLRFVLGAVQNFRTAGAWSVGFALAALVMVHFFIVRAYRENTKLDARATALVADDVAAQTAVPGGGVIAIVRGEAFSSRGTPDNACDDLCQRLLLNGFAKRVLAITLAPQIDKVASRGGRPLPALEPASGMVGVMYWLEERPACPDVKVPDNIRLLRVDEPDHGSGVIATRSASQAMRVKIASGTCLISAPARIDEADGAFFYGPAAKGQTGRVTGFKPAVDTVAAWRTAYYRRDGEAWAVEHRATGVRYQRFPDVLIPTFIHGHGLQLHNGFLRSESFMGVRERYVDDPPVAETLTRLGAMLRIADTGRSDGPAIVDDALATKGELPPMQAAIVEDYLGRMAANRGRRLEPDDVRRILALAADPRIAFNWNAHGAVTMIAEQQPQLSPQLAGTLFGRLDALAASAAVVSEQTSRSIGAISGALAALPAAALKPYFANIEAVANAPALRAPAQKLIARLDVFGGFALPAILRVIDDSIAQRAPRGSNWQNGVSAGLQALCRLGSEGAFARPLLEERVRRDPASMIAANDRMLMITLSRMGASEAEIRDILGFDETKDNRLRSVLRVARGPRACG